ncbi:hypothetical protein CONPUDRAFT_169839 [Coniophora puteana RWD-64-598 SS2]|uniref:Uncharacterized protein n=1 Tax=Coniophora puteana (strain RWD-64-598) TaxID=741705 RepID=A0A5M3M847_CONPW|nr:uncharacterized protein CONPUDRAFT_169839 [Coniophora puteana RWD-64-598 SS2]EIW74965.1 hypothetical protein CONPUDRAFT_169839 [Coniophora puteana RWD-64-598 SS2]
MPEHARGTQPPNIALGGHQGEHNVGIRPRLRVITNNVPGRMSEDALGSRIEDTPDFPASPADDDATLVSEDASPIDQTFPSFSERRNRRRMPVTVTSSVWVEVNAADVPQTATPNLTSSMRGSGEMESEVRRWARRHNLPGSLHSMDTPRPEQTFTVNKAATRHRRTFTGNKILTGPADVLRTGQISRLRRARFRTAIPPSLSVDSLESFLNMPATLNKKSRSAHDAMLDSICNINFDLDTHPSVLLSSPRKTTHDNASTHVDRLKASAGKLWSSLRARLRVRDRKQPSAPDNGETEKSSESAPKEPKERRRRQFPFQLRSRAVTVFTAKMTERLYVAPETSETKHDDESDDEEDEKGGQRVGSPLRANRVEVVASPSNRDQAGHGHWEWVDDDAVHDKYSFCFCFL